MNRMCPTCGRPLGPSGKCIDCGGPKEKKIGLIEALLITGIVIGVLGTIGFGVSKVVGNPFQILNKLKTMQTGVYEVTQASKDLPVSREPQETITPQRIEELRALFENRQFETLNLIYETFQQDFADDFDNEYSLRDAFRVFNTTVPLYEELLAEWIAYSPDDYVPHLASAHYYWTKGWRSRGTRWGKDTTQEQFKMMRQNFRKATDDVKKALDINPNLLSAYIILISISKATSDDARLQDVSQAALELFPHSFLIHAEYMSAIEPRWGGSYRQMENFAKAAEPYAQNNPRFTLLYGYIYSDQAWVLKSQKRYDEAAALSTKAMDFGDSWIFNRDRAYIYHYYLKAPDKALADVEHSIYLRPSVLGSYRLRSKIHFKNNDFAMALDDLQTAIVLDPASAETQRWQQWAGNNLMKKGHNLYQTDLNRAIEKYNLSLMFSPENAEAHCWRGTAYARLGDLDQALDDLKNAIALNPDHFNSCRTMDYANFQNRELDQIIEYWTQFLELEPDHARAYLERAGTYYLKKDLANSLKDLKQSCDLGNKEACNLYDQYKNQ